MLKTYAGLLELIRGRERRRLYAILALMLAMGVVEMVGIVSVFPLLAILMNPETVETNPRLNWAYQTLGFTETTDFLFFVAIGTFVVFVGSILFKIFGLLVIELYVRSQSYRLSVGLFSYYVSLPYRWFLRENSADLGRSILSEVDNIVNGVLMPALNLIVYSIIAVLIGTLLLLIEPRAALLAIGVIGGGYGLVFLVVRRLASRLGKQRFEANAARYRVTQEAFSGVKEIKLMGLERAYVERLRGPARRLVRAQAFSNIVNMMPRQVIEGIAFGAVVLVTIQLLRAGDAEQSRARLEEVLPFLGLFALAAMRLFPALQQIYTSLNLMRMNRRAFEALHGDLRRHAATGDATLPADAPPPIPLERAIEIRDLSFAYDPAARPTLSNLSLRLEAHTSIGIVGGTGAGKTTLIDLMIGLLRPDGGSIFVDGVELGEGNLRAWQRSVGYVPQAIFLIDSTVAANIAFGILPGDIDMERVRRAARAACIDRFIEDELPEGYETVVGERGIRLSGGQRQRIGIARALYHDPALIVFDEATSALDNLTERSVIEALHALSGERTIVMVAHRLTTVMDCDQIIYLEAGRVAAIGTYRQLLEESDGFRAVATATERA